MAQRDNGEVIVNFVSVVDPFYYTDGILSWANLGDIASGHTRSVMMCDNTYYMVVAFSLEDDDDNVFHEAIAPPVVKYGNTDSTMTSYATVAWNSGISKWNAEFDLTDITTPVYWNCRVTLCDSTKTGGEVSTAFTLKGPQPCSRIESLGGGGDPEEEEEEE